MLQRCVCFFLFSLFLIQSAFAQQDIRISVPSQEIFVGEDLGLILTLKDDEGNKTLNAKVVAYSNFFNEGLYDDGKHNDEEKDDGIYGTVIGSELLNNVRPGTYFVTYAYVWEHPHTNGTDVKIHKHSNSFDAPIKILENPVNLLVYFYFIIPAASFIGIYVHRKMSKKKVVRNLEQLKKEREKIKSLMNRTWEDYTKLLITDKVMKEKMEKYKDELRDIEFEIKELTKRKQ